MRIYKKQVHILTHEKCRKNRNVVECRKNLQKYLQIFPFNVLIETVFKSSKKISSKLISRLFPKRNKKFKKRAKDREIRKLKKLKLNI